MVQVKPEGERQNQTNKIKKFLQDAKKHRYCHQEQRPKGCLRMIGELKEGYENVGPSSYNQAIPKKSQSYNVLFNNRANKEMASREKY